MKTKTFKKNIQETESPANAFISKSNEDITMANKEATDYKQENKSVRINLLFRPSTKKNIEKLAYLKHTSTNDFINTVLEEYIALHEADITRYDSIFGED